MNLPALTLARTARLQDIGIGVAVFVIGMVAAFNGIGYSRGQIVARVLILIGVAAAVALYRQAPGGALALVWATLGLHIGSATPIMAIELAVAFVAFGTARYGSRTVVWLSGLSMPAGVLVSLGVLYFGVTFYVAPGAPFSSRFLSLLAPLPRFGVLGWLPIAFLLALIPLVVPWLVGLLLRGRETTRRSQTEQAIAEQDRAAAEAARDQASEIAQLRAQQVQLANDVHDVVGHSLTVILAQAESAQFLPAGDWERVQQTLQTIATSARQSLGDVRQVLSGTTGTPGRSATGTLDTLIDGVRAAGNDVRSTVIGTPQPLPPELDAVAFRVLQEMLTNALKHGRRGGPVQVERHWHGELRIEVINPVDSADEITDDRTRPLRKAAPLGLDGMRRRLESVGGRLDVRRRGEGDDATFTVTAWVPLRPVRVG